MRTTVDINDALAEKARAVMDRRRTTLRALIEEGLRRVVSDEETQADFELEDVSVGTSGLVEGVELHWDAVSPLLYPER